MLHAVPPMPQLQLRTVLLKK